MPYIDRVNPWLQVAGAVGEGQIAMSGLLGTLAQLKFAQARNAREDAYRGQEFALRERAQQTAASQFAQSLALQREQADAEKAYRQAMLTSAKSRSEAEAERTALAKREFETRSALADSLGKQAMVTPYDQRPGFGVYKPGMAPDPGPTPEMLQRSKLVQALAFSNPAALEQMQTPRAYPPWYNIYDGQGNVIHPAQSLPPQVATAVAGAERSPTFQFMDSQDQQYSLDRIVQSMQPQATPPQTPGGASPLQVSVRQPQQGPPQFPNEQAARQAGAKAGDVVQLQGVGIVRLR